MIPQRHWRAGIVNGFLPVHIVDCRRVLQEGYPRTSKSSPTRKFKYLESSRALVILFPFFVAIIAMFSLIRYQVFLANGLALTSVWYAAILSIQNDWASPLIIYAPWWVATSLTVYAILSIFYGVINLEDFPDAALEIEKQITEAKSEMRKRGIIQA